MVTLRGSKRDQGLVIPDLVHNHHEGQAQILVHIDVGGQHCSVPLAAAAQVSLPHQLYLSTDCFSCRAIPFFFFSQLYESVLPLPKSMAQRISSSNFESRSEVLHLLVFQRLPLQSMRGLFLRLLENVKKQRWACQIRSSEQ